MITKWLGLGAVALCASTASAQNAGDWIAYGRDAGGARSSPLKQVSRSNVTRLARAWTYHTGETPTAQHPRSFEATPIVVDGTLFLVTPLGKFIALDPATGHERWRYDAKVSADTRFGDFASRGVSTWVDPRKSRGDVCRRSIIAGTVDARLISLDAATGRPCPQFGNGGTVDLRTGLRNAPDNFAEYEVTSPPAVIGDLIITGSAVADNNRIDAASGEVRAYDARTGVLAWTWDPVPQDSTDPAFRTWRGPNARRTGGANAWSVIAADTALGMVFVPTGSPSPDYFGGERLGHNRYANSIVALKAKTGKVVWHFQTIHHDLWDFDNAAPPALISITRNGRKIPVVVQATKSGQLFVLHRATGEPVFPVVERAVPHSDVKGEDAATTQPFSSVEPLSAQRFDIASLATLPPAARDYCTRYLAPLRNEGIFTPISLRGTIMVPSNIGGAHWGGVAYDPAREIIVVPVNTAVAVARLIPEPIDRDSMRADGRRTGAQYTRMRGTGFWMRREIVRTPDGGLCTPAPLGLLVAVSMKTGRKVWESPLPTPNLGGPIVTAGGLVFMAGTIDRRFRAFNVETGRELWSTELPAGGKATPMTYMANGRQYVVIAAGGDGGPFGSGDALVAFRLP